MKRGEDKDNLCGPAHDRRPSKSPRIFVKRRTDSDTSSVAGLRSAASWTIAAIFVFATNPQGAPYPGFRIFHTPIPYRALIRSIDARATICRDEFRAYAKLA